MMDKNSRIFVAGHRGLVGSAIVRQLEKKGYNNIIIKTRAELDLLDFVAVNAFFETKKPQFVFLAAAKVGGIMANNIYRGQFIYENLQIQNNIIHAAYLNKVSKLLFLGSSCIYPKNAQQPLQEDYLLTDALEYTNEPYAIAKIAGIKMCESYNLQYGTNFIAVMPTNLYGLNDNYDLEKSHVLPALIRKMHLGKALRENNWNAIKDDLSKCPVENVDGNCTKNVIIDLLARYGITKENDMVNITLWGSGKPMREFLHSNDMAEACLFVMENIDFDNVKGEGKECRNTHLNIGYGKDISIHDLALLIQRIVGFKGTLLWDASKPDGTMRKLMDIRKLYSLGWKANISLEEGITDVYQQYLCVK